MFIFLFSAAIEVMVRITPPPFFPFLAQQVVTDGKRKYIQFISATKICHWHIKRFRPTATGVVNQDINFTQLTDGKVCQCREFLFGSNIAAAGKCLTTQLLNFIYNMISCIGVNITDHHRCASAVANVMAISLPIPAPAPVMMAHFPSSLRLSELNT